uniref:Uncharacterized protein n=1 Tax=Clytia hemisphaerica TaxID=252671 RepID=A0A7M5XL86_9CNID
MVKLKRILSLVMKPKCCRLVRVVHKDNDNLRKEIPEKICFFGDNVIIVYLTDVNMKNSAKINFKINVDVLNTVTFRLLHRCVSVMVNFQIVPTTLDAHKFIPNIILEQTMNVKLSALKMTYG